MIVKNVRYVGSGNDFRADFCCELCDYTFNSWGYSDQNFIENVLPNAICPKCKKSSKGETEEEQKTD